MDAAYSINEIRSVLRPVFTQYGIRSAVLFGSYAKGSADIHSDVDILVDSGLRGLQFFGLLESVGTTLQIPVDLIDVTQLEPGSEIEQEIRRTGVPIYGLRNRIVHGYSGVNMRIVWDTVADDVPELHKELKTVLSRPRPARAPATNPRPLRGCVLQIFQRQRSEVFA